MTNPSVHPPVTQSAPRVSPFGVKILSAKTSFMFFHWQLFTHYSSGCLISLSYKGKHWHSNFNFFGIKSRALYRFPVQVVDLEQNHTSRKVQQVKYGLVWYTLTKIRPFPISYECRAVWDQTPLQLTERHSPSLGGFCPSVATAGWDKFLCSENEEHHKAEFWVYHSCHYLKHLTEKCSLP